MFLTSLSLLRKWGQGRANLARDTSTGSQQEDILTAATGLAARSPPSQPKPAYRIAVHVRSASGKMLFVGCLTSQQQASVSQGRILARGGEIHFSLKDQFNDPVEKKIF